MSRGKGQSLERIAGATLALSAAATILAMAHHPADMHSGPAGPLVHGAMIVLLAAMSFGFAAFCAHRDILRPAILLGLIVYGISLFAHIGAGTINGFIVPALAAHGADAVRNDLFLLCWEANQALARLGVFATGAAFLLWSLDLFVRGGRVERALGMGGAVAGAAPALLLMSGAIEMDVRGALLAYALHAAWTLLVGLWLINAARAKSPD